MPYEYYFLKGLGLTVFTELVIGVLLKSLWKLKGLKFLSGIGRLKFMIGVMMASIMTLPYVWFVFTLIKPQSLFIVIAELFAWLMEALFYKYFFEIKIQESLIFSFLLNGVSFVLGLFIFPLII